MAATTIQDRCSWVCQRRQIFLAFWKNAKKHPNTKSFRKSLADVADVA
jgi:hypothetical protein